LSWPSHMSVAQPVNSIGTLIFIINISLVVATTRLHFIKCSIVRSEEVGKKKRETDRTELRWEFSTVVTHHLIILPFCGIYGYKINANIGCIWNYSNAEMMLSNKKLWHNRRIFQV
jgi:hypothetical protein